MVKDLMMDAKVEQETRFLPALAEAIAEWFPELEGRSLAVSEAAITKENVPKLPLVMTAFVRSEANPTTKSRAEMYDVTEALVVEFWLEPARYKKANGSETPFWSYYDYEAIMETLLARIARWSAPGGKIMSFRGLTIEADALAVTLTFAFTATFRWCAPVTEFGDPFTIGQRLCTPVGCCPDACLEDEEDDKCSPC
jgi:hypothetical protein